jgi:AraC family transcriptional regulator
MKEDTQTTYKERILRVQLYIQNNLYEDLSLEELAQVACFSPYHFHRIFRGMVGESVAEHIRRLRLERAAQKLHQTTQSVTDLAFEAGYETVESFTRAFKNCFGAPPSQYKKSHPTRQRINRPIFQTQGDSTMDVQVKQVEPQKVAFVRHIGPYAECAAAWNKLCAWAGPKGLFQPGVQFIGLCYDDPDITPAEKIRYDACLTIDQDIKPEGEIGVQTIEGGLYAMATLHGPYTGLSDLYAQICGQWIPAGGYEIRSLPSFEVYLNSPEETPEEELLTDVYVPIEKV